MKASNRGVSNLPPFLALPLAGWLLWFLFIPVAIVILYSFAERGTYGGILYHFSAENYARAFDWIYLRVFLNSVKLSLFTSLSCLLLGYPMAYVMATSRRELRPFLLTLVMVPFWTNFVIRAFAIKVVMGVHGPIAALLAAVQPLSAPFDLADNSLSVWVGMVTNYLPFMVLPLYVSLEKFDFSLLEAARDLGASPSQAVRQVLLPLTRPGIVTGLIFVFAPSLGEFVIPDLLGGARTLLIGNLVTEQFLKARDWPFGAALSLILILTVLVCLFIYRRNGEAQHAS